MNKENEIIKVSFEFSLMVIEYCELLEENGKYEISRQLLKSGVSIGANIREAQNAESKADFIHKLIISAKEAEVTEYWLLLCKN
jgi:four helix bundle protein